MTDYQAAERATSSTRGEEAPVLYDYWRSSASYRVRIALNLKGLTYRAVAVNLLTDQHRSPEHLARNPQGSVPALDIDGLRLTQSLAIIEYLDETRSEPPLLPSDPAGRARVRALAHVIAMEIHPICNLSVANRIAELGGDAARLEWMREHIGRGLNAFEALLARPSTGRFCHGDAPGLADCCLVPQLYNARRWQLDLSAWPIVARIDAECTALRAFKDAHPDQIGAPDQT
jgi:maleylacetoacetate isomerase